MNFKRYIKCELERDVSDSYHQRSINHFIGGQCMLWFAVLTPWTAAPQALLFMGFSRQEYLSGLPSPPPGGLPDPGMERSSPVSPALQAESLLLGHRGSLHTHIHAFKNRHSPFHTCRCHALSHLKAFAPLSGRLEFACLTLCSSFKTQPRHHFREGTGYFSETSVPLCCPEGTPAVIHHTAF